MPVTKSKLTYVGLMLCFATGLAHAQLVAVDDSYGVPFGQPLFVESLGVLKNDTRNGLTENGGTAELVTGVPIGTGTLSCPDTTPDPGLCTDGSFEYTPGPGFTGTTSFTYRLLYPDETPSAPATVTLTACTEVDTNIFSCWKESLFRAKLTELGYGTFLESFEGAAWGSVRTIGTTVTSAPQITSQGITWTTNHPANTEITTGTGPAYTGGWGGYDPQHGFSTGTTALCVDVPEPIPADCFYHDGLSGEIVTGGDSLHGVGAYISGSVGDNIAISLGGGNPDKYRSASGWGGSSLRWFDRCECGWIHQF